MNNYKNKSALTIISSTVSFTYIQFEMLFMCINNTVRGTRNEVRL